MKSFKIVFINDSHLYSGIFRLSYGLYSNLKNQGVDVEYFQLVDQLSKSKFPEDVKKITPKSFLNIDSWTNLNANRFFSNLKFVTGRNWKLFQKVEGDIIILSSPTLSKLANKLKTNSNKIIVMVHDFYFKYYRKYTLEGLYMRKNYELIDEADFIISNTMFTKGEVIKHLGFPENKIFVIYPFFESQRTINSLEKEKTLNIPINKNVLINVSADAPNKNVKTVLKVLATLEPSYVLIRVGKTKKSTLKLSSKLNLDERVYNAGNVTDNDLRSLYLRANVHLFPSLFEGFGMPALESICLGIPTVTSNTSSLPEVVGDSGILIDPTNISEIKSAIEKIIKSTALRDELIYSGIKRADIFSREKQLEMWDQLMHSISLEF